MSPVRGVSRDDRELDTGHYEVREHMVPGVVGVFWMDADSPRSGDLMMTMSEERLPLLEAALAKRRIRVPAQSPEQT